MDNLLYEGMPAEHARIAAELKTKHLQWMQDVNSPAVQGVRDRQLPSPASG